MIPYNPEYAPVCLFVYNRPFHAERTIDYLKNNLLAPKSELFIYSDGPKNEDSVSKVREVRKVIHSITGFKKIHITERTENIGLSKSIISGVTEILDIYGKIIVLEDDMETSPCFLNYMNEGLQLYSSDSSVASIHAYSYPLKRKLPQSFFLKGADCWGWGTWKRAWDHFEPDGKKLLEKLKELKLTREFNFDNSFPYTKMLTDQIKGKNDSWAIRWYASAFLDNKYTLYPFPSLVRNIGFDNSGTHSGISKKFLNELPVNYDSLKKIPVEENEEARKAFGEFFRKQNNILNLSVRAFNKIMYRLIKLTGLNKI